MSDSFVEELAAIEEYCASNNIFEFELHSYDGRRLVIAGAFDPAYSHEIEVMFDQPTFASIPVQFSDAKIRVASDAESVSLSPFAKLEKEETVFVIDAECGRPDEGRNAFFVIAEGVTHRSGTVYHYEREDLREGEEIDPILEFRKRREHR